MGKKIFLVCLIMISFFIPLESPCENTKGLIIHITGICGIDKIHGLTSEQFNRLQRVDSWVAEILKTQFGDTRVFETIHYPGYGEYRGKEIEVRLLEKEIFPKMIRFF